VGWEVQFEKVGESMKLEDKTLILNRADLEHILGNQPVDSDDFLESLKDEAYMNGIDESFERIELRL
jgi:hypothetical protein